MRRKKKSNNPFSNKPFSANESNKLIGSPDYAGESLQGFTNRMTFSFDTNKVAGIDMNSIHFVSDDGELYGEIQYQPKGATDAIKKLNYLVALNAYNTAHQNNIETEIRC